MAKNTPPHTEPAGTRPKKDRRRRATPTQKLLTMKQVEDLLGVPVRTIHTLHIRGQLPAVRFCEGGQKWFRRADVEALIERHLERLTG